MTLWRSIIFHYGGPDHIETSPLVCRANQWTCFYMIGTFVMKELKKSYLFEVYSSFLSAFDTSQILLMASYLLNNFKTSLCVINRNLHTLLISSYDIQRIYLIIEIIHPIWVIYNVVQRSEWYILFTLSWW